MAETIPSSETGEQPSGYEDHLKKLIELHGEGKLPTINSLEPTEFPYFHEGMYVNDQKLSAGFRLMPPHVSPESILLNRSGDPEAYRELAEILKAANPNINIHDLVMNMPPKEDTSRPLDRLLKRIGLRR